MRTRISLAASRCLGAGLVALSLLALAGALGFGTGRDSREPALVVDEPARLLGDVVARSPVEVQFRVRNTTRSPARVVGGPSPG
jgi:hypothetical protein